MFMLKTLRNLRASTPIDVNGASPDPISQSEDPGAERYEARYRDMKILAKNAGMPSAYLATLPYRSREGVTFCSQGNESANMLSNVAVRHAPFVNRDLMANLLKQLSASLGQEQPSGMGTELNEAQALHKAVKAYRHNLARIAPGAPEILETFYDLEHFHKVNDQHAVRQLTRALAALQHREALEAVKSFFLLTRGTHTALVANPHVLGALPQTLLPAAANSRDYITLTANWLKNKQLIPIARIHSRKFEDIHRARTGFGAAGTPSFSQPHARENRTYYQLTPSALALTLARSDNDNLVLFGKLAEYMPVQFEHWLEIAKRRDLPWATKITVTADFYTCGLLPDIQTLLAYMNTGKAWRPVKNGPEYAVQYADVYLVLRALCELPPSIAPQVAQRRDADFAAWHEALWQLSQSADADARENFEHHRLHTSEAAGLVMPAAAGAAGLDRYPAGSPQRIAFMLRYCSDTQALGELQAMSATRDLSNLLVDVARARKPECLAFLLGRDRHTVTGLTQALHAMLEDSLHADWVRPRGKPDPTRLAMLQMAKQLVEHGANLGGYDEGQPSVLHEVVTLSLHDGEPQAVRKQQCALIEIMLQRGAGINGRDALGRTPFAARILQIKGAWKSDRIARLLRQKGGHIDAPGLLKRLRRCARTSLEEVMPVAGKIGALSILLKDSKLNADALAILKKSPLTDHWSAETILSLGYELINTRDRT